MWRDAPQMMRWQGYVYYTLAFALALLAVFTKENGITLVGVFILIELLFDRREPAPATPQSLLDDVRWVFGGVRSGFITRLSILVAWTTAVMTYRVSVHNGARLYAWTVLENRMVHMAPVSSD